MVELREEVEHNIWWQLKSGEMSFWFDNWTKQGALYFLEDHTVGEEEIEVKKFITNEGWNIQKLGQVLSEELVEYITKFINPHLLEEEDKPWWMGNTSGEFTVKSVFDLLRSRKENEEWRGNMWCKQIPFKMSFLLWRIWRGRIATEENLKRMGITIASRCYCCDVFEEETTQHLFLTAPIAQKLWKQFTSCAGIQQQGNLKQMITEWWKRNTPIKIQFLFQAIPIIIVWELWKRRNARRHGMDTSFFKLRNQCVNTIIQLIKMKYPWIKVPREWEEIVKVLREYKLKLHYCTVSWRKPYSGTLKCNTDGVSRGNPGESAYAFCLRNDKGDIVYAEAERLGIRTNMEAETTAIIRALRFIKCHKYGAKQLEGPMAASRGNTGNTRATYIYICTDSACFSRS
ncbi:hypothetical protein KY285_026535 [Solanum tuberosum]|nr:hypothetical protein KY285_026535 [Solanum tuberosum]